MQPNPLTCSDVRERLPLSTSGDLEPDVAQSVATHLAGCDACLDQAALAARGREALCADLEDSAALARGLDLWTLLRPRLAEDGLFGPRTPARRPVPATRLALRALSLAAAAGLLAYLFLRGAGDAPVRTRGLEPGPADNLVNVGDPARPSEAGPLPEDLERVPFDERPRFFHARDPLAPVDGTVTNGPGLR